MSARRFARWMVASLICAPYVGAIAAQTLTVREAARLHGVGRGPLYLGRFEEPNPLSLASMVRGADLIVEGSLTLVNTSLSNDQRWLTTEFAAGITRTLADRGNRIAQRLPGPNPVLIRQSGGRSTFDGVDVIAEVVELPLLPVDEPLLLCLKYDGTTDRYEIVGTFAAFAIRQATVVPLAKSAFADEHFKGLAHERFIGDLQTELAFQH